MGTYQREHLQNVSACECCSAMCLTWSTAALLYVNMTGSKLVATINQKLDFLLYPCGCKLFLADSYAPMVFLIQQYANVKSVHPIHHAGILNGKIFQINRRTFVDFNCFYSYNERKFFILTATQKIHEIKVN
jgi:hypothetical protein